MPLSARPRKGALSVRETALFAMIGVMMYAGKAVMEPLPNIHPLALFTVTVTLVYRRRALYPIYAYVLVNGLFAGLAPWWLPYLYLWTLLWGGAMLLPRAMGAKRAAAACCALCTAHGLAFGALYAPVQALMYGLSREGMLAWIIAGLPFDAVHAAGNFAMSLLVVPLTRLLTQLSRRANIPCSPPAWAEMRENRKKTGSNS